MIKNIYKKFTYNTAIYRFREMIEDLYQTKNLEKLHQSHPQYLPKEKLEFSNESQTDFHKHFYNKLNNNWSEFINCYEKFIEDQIRPQFSESILYQYLPSFRAQIPNDQAIHKWHHDSDKDHNHPEGEINYCIPITEMKDTTAIWIESEPNKGDFSPMNISFGEYHRFNGNKCNHGNKKNISGSIRFSLDFRILPLSKYKANQNKASLTASKKFELGDYYKKFN